MNSKAQVKRKLRHVVRFVVNVALNRLNFRTAAGNRAWAIISYVQHRIPSYRSIFFPNIRRFWTFFIFFPSATNVGITNERRFFMSKAKRTIFNRSFSPRAVPVEGTIYWHDRWINLLFVCLAHHYFKEYDVFGLKISKRTSPHLKAVTNHNG